MSKLKINTNINNLNTGIDKGLKVERVSLSEIIIDNEFKEIFIINNDVLNDIKKNIEKNGLDKKFPLFVWEVENQLILIDGHTRFQALNELNKSHCYVTKCNFKDREDAKNNIFKYQLSRRNLSDAEKIKYADVFKKGNVALLGSGNKKGVNFKKEISEKLNVSETQARKIQKIIKNPEKKKDVISGRQTINKAYNEILLSEKEDKKPVIHDEIINTEIDIKSVENYIKSAIRLCQGEILEEKKYNELILLIDQLREKINNSYSKSLMDDLPL